MPQQLNEFDTDIGAEPVQHDAASEAAHDREGAMAKADLYKLASYSHKLYKQLHDDDQLEGWVQAKITKAADYIASVYHYLEYEMKFNEYGQHLDNADTLSESQKSALKARLTEAKEKMKELKKAQAAKVSSKNVDVKETAEKTSEREIEMKKKGGGTVKVKATQYKGHQSKAADKEAKKEKDLDEAKKKNGDGNLANNYPPFDKVTRGDVIAGATGKDQKGGKAVKEGKAKKCDECGKSMKLCECDPTMTYEGKVEDHHKDLVHAAAIVAGLKRRKADGKKAGTPAKADMPADIGTEVEDESMMSMPSQQPRQVHPKVKAKLEKYGKETEAMAAAVKRIHGGKDSEFQEGTKKPMSRAAKGYEKFGPEGMKKLAQAGKDGASEKELDAIRDKYNKYDESAPSAGLSKEKKSAVVKKAKAGGDIGKPGKGFDKLAKKAGGGEKGEKIAAAAMWKNIKETVAYIEEKKGIVKKDKVAKGDKLADEGNEFSGELAKAKAQHKDSFSVDGKTYPVKESSELTRMQESIARLNRSEKPALVENREVDQIRALTKILNG
jgi:hypothetical protein